MKYSLVNLTSICKPKQWKTISASDLLESGYSVYGANGKIGFYSKYTHKFPTVMITCRGATCGNVHISEPKSYINGNAMALDDLDSKIVDTKYLRYCLINRRFDDVISGSAQPQITRQGLGKVKIPLPPIEIQKQISSILARADQLRKDCQRMEQEFNNLVQSVFIDMFGDPGTNPKEWPLKSISSFVKEFQGGKSIVSADDESSQYKNKVLKISAVTSGEFNADESKPLPNEYEPPIAHFVKKSDLIFSRANTTELVGATAMVFDSPENILLPDKLWRFIWKEEINVSPIYIWQLFLHEGQRLMISKLSSGSGGSMKNISKAKLNTLKVIFPPYELQEQFSEKYLVIREQLKNLKMLKQFYEDNYNSLMQKTFNGKLNFKSKEAV